MYISVLLQPFDKHNSGLAAMRLLIDGPKQPVGKNCYRSFYVSRLKDAGDSLDNEGS